MYVSKMARVIRGRIGFLSFKYYNRSLSRTLVPVKHSRICFHTSMTLDVKGKELLMPSLSPTMESGTIVKWLKKEGEKIEPGDAVADIQTDKAVVTMEMEDEGVLAKILVPEGTQNIKVGQLIALTVDPDDDWKTVEMPTDATSPSPSDKSKEAPTSSVAEEHAEPPPGQQNISMPALSPTMSSGTIVKWHKKEGDHIEPGDALADIQTDKAIVTFEFDEEATFAKILVPEGTEVAVGQLIAITVEKGMDPASIVIPTSTKPTQTPTQTSAKPAPSAPTATKSTSRNQVYGLAVKRLLEEYGLTSDQIEGTGRPNRLLKSDVLAYIQNNNVQKVAPRLGESPKVKESISSKVPTTYNAPSTYEDIPVSNIRGVIAKRLGDSKGQIPHSYAVMDIKIDKLNEIRLNLKEDNINLSINDFIVKAVAHALVECSDVNALYQNGQVVYSPKIDISVAVAAPTGLITPIVFDAASKSLVEVSTCIRELAVKAKEGTLKPNEFQGGTFTISNLGMFGIKEFSAIINPPQTAILAVGSGREELDHSLRKMTKMSVTLSYDRRAIDEDQAANFLAVLRAMLEDPTFLSVGRAQALRYRRD